MIELSVWLTSSDRLDPFASEKSPGFKACVILPYFTSEVLQVRVDPISELQRLYALPYRQLHMNST